MTGTPIVKLDPITEADLAAGNVFVSRWRPIETAPMDARAVLVCWANDGNCSMAVASWDEDYAALDFAEGVGWRDGSDYGCGGMIGAMPTHWMPLPEPPNLAPNTNEG